MHFIKNFQKIYTKGLTISKNGAIIKTPKQKTEGRNTMNNFFIATAFNPNPAKTITAHFKNGTNAQYTMDIYNLLISDKDIECITDGETGEIIYTK